MSLGSPAVSLLSHLRQRRHFLCLPRVVDCTRARASSPSLKAVHKEQEQNEPESAQRKMHAPFVALLSGCSCYLTIEIVDALIEMTHAQRQSNCTSQCCVRGFIRPTETSQHYALGRVTDVVRDCEIVEQTSSIAIERESEIFTVANLGHLERVAVVRLCCGLRHRQIGSDAGPIRVDGDAEGVVDGAHLLVGALGFDHGARADSQAASQMDHAVDQMARLQRHLARRRTVLICVLSAFTVHHAGQQRDAHLSGLAQQV